MWALKIDRHGSADDLRVSEVDRPRIASGLALIEIEAAGVNPSDLVSAEGRFPHAVLPRILGRDFAGTVVDGPDELVGKKVWGTGGDLGIDRDGTHAEYLSVPVDAVSIRPTRLSAEQAACVGVPFHTAWISLFDRGRLEPGETVIVTGATGSVGSAAIQLASAHGARVVAFVRKREDRSRLDLTRIVAVADQESGNLIEVVGSVTGGKMANLAINAVGAALVEPLLASLADYGRLVAFSVLSGRELSLDLLNLYRRNLSVLGVNSVSEDVVRATATLTKMATMFQSGVIAPPEPTLRLPLSEARRAYQSIGGGEKPVLIPDRFFTA
jgi:NADPH:quinone reductase-like Zn-dependent oxidoreductase